jgi:diguanylate cyclase (GGDEF)-like protein
MTTKRKSTPRAFAAVTTSGESESPSLAPNEVTHPATILVVDDDPSGRNGLELLLQSVGYRVAAVPNAEAALELTSHQSFDLVLCDVNLGGTSGYTLTRALRRAPLHTTTPIILISCDARARRIVQGLDAGADDFVAKPIDFDELLARIRRHLERAERERALRRRCTYDAVTAVLSRAAIEEETVREMKRAHRSGLPLSVLLVDLDGFKAINDRYGHAAGDDALRAAAETLVRLLRSTDRVGRIGGDEFLAILPDTGATEVLDLVNRLQLAWRRSPPRPRGITEPVLVSIGHATAQRGDSVTALVHRADRSMYENKASRRACAVRAAPA